MQILILFKIFLRRINPAKPGYFAPDNLRAVFQESLKAFGPHKIRVFYLHAPDRSNQSAPFEDTLREINEFHKAGHMLAPIRYLFLDLRLT
jgi:aflatoxin B1 aldehyde reductase